MRSDATSGNPSQNHRGNHRFPDDHGTDGNIHDFRKSLLRFECTNVGCLKSLCCPESKLATVEISDEAIKSESPDLNEKFPEVLHLETEDFKNIEPASEAIRPTVPRRILDDVKVCEKQTNSTFSDSGAHSATIAVHESSEVEQPSPDEGMEKNGPHEGFGDEDDDVSQERLQSNLLLDQQTSKDKEKRKDCVVTDDIISCYGHEADVGASSQEVCLK